jgi:hypothetical protein
MDVVLIAASRALHQRVYAILHISIKKSNTPREAGGVII